MDGLGYTFSLRVDGAAPRGLWPPVGGGLCRRVVKKKVLKMDRPLAGGFLSLTGLWPEGCGIARRAMSIKSALRDNLAVSYGMIGILQVGSLRSPPPIRLRRTSPYSGGRIKDLEASLRKRQCTLHRQGKDSSLHSYCPTACGGKVVRSTKRGEPQVSEGWQV